MNLWSPVKYAALTVILTASYVAPVYAFEQKTFDAAQFKSAQDGGKPVVVHVTAPWCPTCKAQHQVLDTLSKNTAYDAVTVFTVDFDSKPDVWKSLKARSQSTLIAFEGAKETGRLAGETAVKPIEALIQSSIAK
jgi:thioredoxin 1